jgi:cellulose synthase/poly-beta-1,6-N-acetylglucosamine synthase-like glycosyltransferase/transposase-like protein
MTPKLSKEKRIELIKRALAGESVKEICEEVGISRVLFYRWLKRYRQEGKEGVKAQKPGRPQRGKRSRRARRKAIKKGPYTRLNASEKLKIVKSVLEKGRSVTKVAEECGVSRTTIYKWIKRYQTTSKDIGVSVPEAQEVQALKAKKRQVKRYFGQTPEEYVNVVLSIVTKHPEYGIRRIVDNLPKVAGKPIVGHHGVQNILRRHNLSTYEERLVHAQSEVTPVTQTIAETVKVSEKFFGIPVETRNKIIRFASTFALSAFVTIVLFGFGSYVSRSLSQATGASRLGMFFASTALLMGSIFFLYSFKYYLTLAVVLSFSQQEGVAQRNGNGNGRKKGLLSWILGLTNGNGNGNGKGRTGPVGLEPNLEHIKLKRYPFFSIHIPFYNEKNVVERAITAATGFDYKGDYEIILCDDSTDETTQIIRDYQKKYLSKGEALREVKGDGWELTAVEVRPGVVLKHLHRTSRSGFKGGALRKALTLVNPKTELVSVFDADFVPYPDTLELFLKYFKVQNNMSEDYKSSDVAAVCGYQWHVLNKSENWITRGIRAEYSGSYVVERSGREILGGMKIIHGSVYAIRKDVLEDVGWDTSITEDFELTLKLYNAGYKVVYTPYIQAPAECVSTIKRLVRQRMRWSEGHSYNVKKMWKKLLFNPKLTFSEKLEFIYLAPYYLQAFFFLVGTFSWLLSETIFPAQLPFWTSLWGWSLVLTNMFSLPLMNAVGLFLEESEERDYLGLLSFVALSYIMVPFQAYASFKGFIENKEGPWFRTPKTGRITDVFTRGRFYRFIAGVLPSKETANVPVHQSINQQYLALSSANNRFNSFNVRQRRNKWLSKAVLSILLALSVSFYSATKGVPEVMASNWTNLYLRSDVQACTGTNAMTTGTGSSNSSQEISETNPGPYYWYSDSLPTGTIDASITAGTWTVYTQGTYYTGGGGSNVKFTGTLDLVDSSDCSNNPISLGTATSSPISGQGDFPYSLGITVTAQTITTANPKRIRLTLQHSSSNKGAYMDVNFNNASPYDSNLQPSTLTVPENVILFIGAAFFIPFVVSRFKKRRGR